MAGLRCRERNGNYKYIKAKKYAYWLAAVIATPAILLSQKLCNSSGLVGKNLMLHPWGYVEGQLRRIWIPMRSTRMLCHVAAQSDAQ